MIANEPVLRIEEALRQAMFALDRRRPGDAERIAVDLLSRAPQHSRAHYVLGCALLMQGRGEEAVEHLESAARGRADPEIDTLLGIALRQAARFDEAQVRLRRAIKRRPPYGPAFYELGCLLVARDDYDDAIEIFRRGLEVAP